jgi:hypothetical protein
MPEMTDGYAGVTLPAVKGFAREMTGAIVGNEDFAGADLLP